MKRTGLLLLGIIIWTCLSAQQVSVAPYQGGRDAAVTYTFDDGLQDQYTLAFPELRKRGLKATFAVIGSKVGGIVRSSQDKAMGITGTPAMTWDMLREMAADGQEISSHGWEHKNVTKLSAEQLRFEVQHNDTMIYLQTGHFPRTYFFPGNRHDSVVLTFCQQERVGCRTTQIAIGSKHDSIWLNRWVDGLIARGEWGVGMTHGIATGYDHFSDPKVLWSHWDYITAHQDHVWVATFHDVAAYMAERDNAILSISTHPDVLIVNVTCTLSSSLYNVPLTLVINQEAGARSVRQGNRDLPIYCRNGKTLVDIDPHGGAIEIDVDYGQRQTPVMGWSSWNTYRVNISDSLIMRQADAMVQKGLKDAGYTYINIDDGFFGYRDSLGVMHAHPQRFPGGMKAVADYIHSLGLKAGIYSDAGAVTCGSIWDKDSIGIGAGLYGHEEQDARLYFHDWGFDFIKIDYCGAGQELDLDERERYTAIRQVINRVGRSDVEINICRWAFPGTWAKDLAASWRISSDIRDSWGSVKSIIAKNMPLSAYCRDGHFNDMDMLEIGRSLSESEERVHFGLWCIMSSPLLIGCDMTTIPESSLRLLKNAELIAINQDSLALQAYPVQTVGGTYVLVKDIERRRGTTRAVALYNPTNEPRRIAIALSELELQGKTRLRDLFAHKDLNPVQDSVAFNVAPHDVVILRAEAERRIVPTRYEAEWAYLPLYNDLGKRKKEVRYMTNKEASGDMVVTMAGGSPENSIVWPDVYSEQGGRYDLTIYYLPSEIRGMEANVNGSTTTVSGLATSGAVTAVTIPVTLKPGYNFVELTCATMWLPDIDKIELKKK